MTTELEVIDTAVKVGLGAIIAGVTSYFLAVTNHKKEVSRTYTAESLSLLKQVALNLAEGASLTNNACQRIGNIINGSESDSSINEELLNYVEAVNKNRDAKVYAHLLGAKNIVSLIDELQDSYQEEIDYIRLNGLNTDFSVVNEHGNTQGEIRVKLGEEYGDFFKQIFT